MKLRLSSFALIALVSAELVLTLEQLHHGDSKRQELLEITLQNDFPHQRYLLNISVGTPPQSFAVTLDSGSCELWLPTWNSSGCAPNSCPPGSLRPEDSSSIIRDNIHFEAWFGLGTDFRVIGEYYNDTVMVGGVAIPDAMFAIGDVPKPLFDAGLWGILGLGSRYRESHYELPDSPFHNNKSALYTPIWERFAPNRLFSVWLNTQSAKEGSVLFGGIDDSKYEGDLRVTPVRRDEVENEVLEWHITLTSVAVVGEDGTIHDSTPSNFTRGLVLDTGSPNMYLPTPIFNLITAPLNITYHQNFPYTLCSRRSSTSHLEFGFSGLGDQKGPVIKVSYEEVIYSFGNPANIGEVRNERGEDLCYVGVIPQDSWPYLLGASMIRSAYVVFDAANAEVKMAQAKHESCK